MRTNRALRCVNKSMKRVSIGWWWAIAFVAVVVLAFALPRQYRYVSHSKAATELAEHIRAGKWERIGDYISDDELRIAALTRPQVERLFAEYVRPAVAKENADLTPHVHTTEYNSTVTVGNGFTMFQVLLTNYPALMKPTFGLGIRTSLNQIAVMRLRRSKPDLQGKARRAELGRQLAVVESECKAFGLKALPAVPASASAKSLQLFP